jgi:hypothetical protein
MPRYLIASRDVLGSRCGRLARSRERRLRERLDALGPAPRAELLHVLMLPDLEHAVVGVTDQAAKADYMIDRGTDSWPPTDCRGQPVGTYASPVPPWQSPSVPTAPTGKP